MDMYLVHKTISSSSFKNSSMPYYNAYMWLFCNIALKFLVNHYRTWENFGGEKYWWIWQMNHDLPNFYPPNILFNRYRMVNRQLSTLQTFIYSTNDYTSLTYKNGANRRDNPRNVSNYSGSLLYSNGRRIMRISYLPFTIKQLTIPNVLINMMACTENSYSILQLHTYDSHSETNLRASRLSM